MSEQDNSYGEDTFDYELEDEIASDDLADSTITSVRHVMNLQGVNEFYYQNFMMLEREDGYVVADKMTGEVLLKSNLENDLSVNNISPYAAEVLLDACVREERSFRTLAALQEQAEILDDPDGFGLIIENTTSGIPIIDFEVDGPGIEEDIEL